MAPSPPPGRRRRWLRRAFFVVVALLVVLGAFACVTTGFGAAFGAAPEGERLARMKASSQHNGEVFENPAKVPVMREGQDGLLTEWLFGEGRTPDAALPLVTDAPSRFDTPPSSGLRVTWLGHSTILVEIDGVRVLTDPMWSERASPSTMLGPRRFHPPPAPLDEIGPLDAVVLSHDHYDHLDMETVRALKDEVPLFLVPLGLGAHLEAWGIPPEKIREHDWWEETRVGEVRLVATPAQHFSGRGLWDRNRTLWTSWTFVGPVHRVFFSGDTGLAPQFPEIAARHGPFDLVMLEVGAFHPSWGDIHLGPRQALLAFEQLGGGKLLPIHWSTFELALHPWQEPAETLYTEAKARGLSVVTPKLGEVFEPTQDPPDMPWWR